MLTQNDIKILQEKGISKEKIDYQISLLKKGTPYVKLVRPATPNDGIIVYDENEINGFIKAYEEYLSSKSVKVVKFVPASGAATRMFKEFFTYLADDSGNTDKYPQVKKFCENVEKFAFYDKLNAALIEKFNSTVTDLIKNNECKAVVDALINGWGLNYGNTPKGLIDFHKYGNGEVRTAFKEHLYEGVDHISSSGKAYFHFTVSPEFNADFERLAGKYEELRGVSLDIEFSNQYHSTDTIALDDENNLVRTETGDLLFRPGGHGSLIKNLATINADMIFIKNIDNIAHADYIEMSVRYKKFLGGGAGSFKKTIDEFLQKLNKNGSNVVKEIKAFLKKNHFIDELPSFDSTEEEVNFYKKFLDRPLRVAGMVKNEGEPGGGPFWIRYKGFGFSTLQIVEKSQINTGDCEQKQILDASTHFNPVDMVVIFDKEKHNLQDFVDNDTFFISHKSYKGKNIKALEWPGLWNGAMSDWLTAFVEVPLETFNPVKVVTDLLKKYHQPLNS